MRRRDFIAMVGGTAVTWPASGRAQQRSAMPVVGFLNALSPQVWAPYVAAFRQGLKETGYAEGENVTIEYRWAQNSVDRLPGLAAELVRLGVAVIVTSGGDAPMLAAKEATATIPIVATMGGDPVESHLVASLSRPGGNVTGVSVFSSELVAKRLELLRELLPSVSLVAFLANPTIPYATADRKSFEAAAATLGLKTLVVTATSEAECETAFANLVRQGAGAVLIESDAFFRSIKERIVALAKESSLPVVYSRREYVTAGGLISYASSLTAAYRQLGVSTGRILKGEKPAELPVVQPTMFELVINLKAAKALGLTIPASLLYRADEVLE
jgi:putative ABC transport system substrate-binding protein